MLKKRWFFIPGTLLILFVCAFAQPSGKCPYGLKVNSVTIYLYGEDPDVEEDHFAWEVDWTEGCDGSECRVECQFFCTSGPYPVHWHTFEVGGTHWHQEPIPDTCWKIIVYATATDGEDHQDGPKGAIRYP